MSTHTTHYYNPYTGQYVPAASPDGTVPQYHYYSQYASAPGTVPSQVPAPNYYLNGWFDYRNPAYIKGAVVGAVAALILTNPGVKKMLVKSVVGIWDTLQGGVEEFKEQIRDIQAEKGEE